MVTLRKNGLLSSCEPCRKSKLRCDHGIPVCERCSRTKKADRCIYRPSSSMGTRATKASLASATPTAEPEANLVPLESSREERPTLKRRLSQCESYGMTSHFALFQESTDHLGATIVCDSHHDEEDPSVRPPLLTLESKDVKQGSYLLRLLRDLPIYQKIADGWLDSTHDGEFAGRKLVEETFASLQEFSGVHSPQCDMHALTLRSRDIFHQFSNQIPLSASLSFKEYMSNMSCRWEIIGLAFCFVGLGSMLASDWESIFKGRPVIPRRDLGTLALSATETCLRFCNEAGVLNDALSWLIGQHLYFMTLIHGDRDYRSWRALGDLSTIVFSLGLNQSSNDDDDDPFWLIQLRRRLMGHAFSCDKQLATFLGRPPRISWRFCNISLPLDLSFAEIVSEPTARNMAISKLDATGWNTEKSDTQALWLRAQLILGPLRENILELSLSQEVEDLPARIEELVQKSHQTWDTLPAFVRKVQDLDNCTLISGCNQESIVGQINLEYMYNRFLLYLILSKRSNNWSPDLIQVSHEILSEILNHIDNRVKTMHFAPELSWIMSFYGLPVVGVLSIELLRRIGSLSMNVQDIPANPVTTFPRSRVIQDLSIFASYLRTIVQPYEGNYGICQKAREAILRVLDVVLSPEASGSVYPEMQAVSSTTVTSNPADGIDNNLDYNYYITHLDNWQWELQNSLDML